VTDIAALTLVLKLGFQLFVIIDKLGMIILRQILSFLKEILLVQFNYFFYNFRLSLFRELNSLF